MSFLGLDIGTGSCKACAFDAEGHLLASAAREYSLRHAQPGWAELDSRLVGDLCLEVIREVAATTPDDPVQALTISSQGEAFTCLDREGEVLSDAMVSSDNRAAGLVEAWVGRFGVERLYEKTGHTAHPIFTLFKLLWLQQNRPEIWSAAGRFLCFEDYLHTRFGVEPAISWSLAGRTLLFNVAETKWDDEILAAVGLRSDQLARPLPPGAIVGTIPPDLVRDLHLAPGAIVVTGGHDQVCCAVGSGAISSGQASLATGSVECVAVAFAEPTRHASLREANLCTYSHALPGRYASLAYNLTGGNLLRWFRDELAGLERMEARQNGQDVYDFLLGRLPENPGSLMVLPYFTGSGTPYFDSHTPGAILGLRFDTTREEILLGLLEGLAYELRLNIELLRSAGIPMFEILAVGGGARNRRWLQLKADLLNQPIQVPEVTETGCLGGAILACAAVTGHKVEDLVGRWIRMRDTVYPDPARAAHYEKRLGDYRKTYAALKSLSAGIF